MDSNKYEIVEVISTPLQISKLYLIKSIFCEFLTFDESYIVLIYIQS